MCHPSVMVFEMQMNYKNKERKSHIIIIIVFCPGFLWFFSFCFRMVAILAHALYYGMKSAIA